MKKTYITPECEIIAAEAQVILTDSKSVTANPNDTFNIGYGGQDTDGTKDPASISWGMDNWDTLDD